MTSNNPHDPIAEELARLQLLAPEHEWTDRIRTRCRTQFGRSQKRLARTHIVVGFVRRVFVPVLVGCVCVLYVAALVVTTLRLQGVFD